MKLTKDHVRIAENRDLNKRYRVTLRGTPMHGYDELRDAAQEAEHMAAQYDTTKPSITVHDAESDETVYTVKYEEFD